MTRSYRERTGYFMVAAPLGRLRVRSTSDVSLDELDTAIGDSVAVCLHPWHSDADLLRIHDCELVTRDTSGVEACGRPRPQMRHDDGPDRRRRLRWTGREGSSPSSKHNWQSQQRQITKRCVRSRRPESKWKPSDEHDLFPVPTSKSPRQCVLRYGWRRASLQ